MCLLKHILAAVWITPVEGAGLSQQDWLGGQDHSFDNGNGEKWKELREKEV